MRKMDDPEINRAVREGLAQNWAPEQIAGRMRQQARYSAAPCFARRRQEEHNHERPHSSLDYQTPAQFAAACAASAPAAPALQQHTRKEEEEDEETLLPVTQPILS